MRRSIVCALLLAAGCSSPAKLDVTLLTSPLVDEQPFTGVDNIELRWTRPGQSSVLQHGSWSPGSATLTLTPPPLVDGSTLELAVVSSGVVIAVGRTPPLFSDTPSTSVYVGLVNQFSSAPASRPIANVRFGSSATLIGDGRVLIAGGATRGSPGVPDPSSITALIDLYDPLSGTFGTFTGAADFTERIYHAAGATPDGGVIFAGGLGKFGPLDDVYAIGPTMSSKVGKLPSPRWGAASVSLDDGRLVLVGGYTTSDGTGGGTLATDGLIVGVDGSVSAVTLPWPRALAAATLLANGTVLVSGGKDDTGVLDSGLLFDPTAKSFAQLAPATARAAMLTPRFAHTATRLPSGDVFIFGGNDGHESVGVTEMWSADAAGFVDTHVFNLAPRERHTAVALFDGTIVLAGGESSPQPLADPSPVLDPIVYRPSSLAGATGVLDDSLTNATARAEATATALIDGSVLYVGGGVGDPRTLAGGAEIFVPCFGSCLNVTP